MPEVVYRILFNVPDEFPKLEVMLFAEQLYRLRSLGVRWDLIALSHDEGHRAVEVIIYEEAVNSHHEDGRAALTAWLKSNNIEYRLMGNVLD
jgi:hypothetical protein